MNFLKNKLLNYSLNYQYFKNKTKTFLKRIKTKKTILQIVNKLLQI